jgi:tRNA G10  N-methylase Trm11
MSQRESGYERKERDAYQTPAWVTLALVPHLRELRLVWEPACGDGAMVEALTAAGLEVTSSDIAHGYDFPELGKMIGCDGIITNPPYALAQEFIEHALDLMKPGGLVAMLLRTDYDHAKTRAHLFHGCPASPRSSC